MSDKERNERKTTGCNTKMGFDQRISQRKEIQRESFAAGANREQIATCTDLGIELDELIELGVEAMQGIAPSLGL